MDKIILNQVDRILSDETLEETTSTCDRCYLEIRPESLLALKILNQPTLNPSPSSNRSSLILLSEKIHKTSYFSEDKGTSSPLETSNSLGIGNLLVSKNPEHKRIVCRKNIVSELFILENIEDKSISNYKLIV